VGAGIALGLAALARSLGVVLLAASLAWLVLGRGRRGWQTAAIVGVVAACVIAPWSWRASERADTFVPVDVNGGFNFWSGNNEYIPSDVQGLWAVGLPLENGLDQRFLRYYPDDQFRRDVPVRMAADGVRDTQGPDGAAWYLSEAKREVARRPLGVLQRLPRKLATLWAPDFFLPRHLLRDWYGPTSPAAAAVLVFLTWAAAALALIGGPAALAALRRDRFRSLALAWVGVYLLLHGVVYGHTRMHQPLIPVLLLSVAALLFDPNDRPDLRRLLRRGAPIAALVLAAWIWIHPLVGGLYVSPGPRHAGMARVLAVGREWPLPGTERLLWMLAGVEASRGDNVRASRMLAESRHSELPWTLLLRALTAATPEESRTMVERALEKDPDLEAAQELRDRMTRILPGVPPYREE
jgi:hypothetical protein